MASNVTAALKPHILYEQIWKENCSKIIKLYYKNNCSCSQRFLGIKKYFFFNFILQQNCPVLFILLFHQIIKE